MITLAILCLLAGTVWAGFTRSWPLALIGAGLFLEALDRYGLHIR